MTKKDFRNSIITGLTTGIIFWRIFDYLGAADKFPFPIILLPIIVPLLWVIGVQLGYILGNFIAPFRQFGKFAAIGFTNAAVDFGIFNFLYFLSNENTRLYAYLNAISFTCSVIHSYFWNKNWSFDGNKGTGGFYEFVMFIVVALGALAVNVGIATFVFHFVDPVFGLDTKLWANMGKVVGSAVALIFSFVGFRVLVFNRK